MKMLEKVVPIAFIFSALLTAPVYAVVPYPDAPESGKTTEPTLEEKLKDIDKRLELLRRDFGSVLEEYLHNSKGE